MQGPFRLEFETSHDQIEFECNNRTHTGNDQLQFLAFRYLVP